MSNRIHLALLLVLYCFVFWDESPDAIAPLIFAVPYFTIPTTKIFIPHLAAWTGWISLVIALVAFTERHPRKFTIAAKIGLSVSACLFVACSSPITFAAMTAIPFAVAVAWPQRKQKSPNQALQATAATPRS
jgi:hypothetical protein